MVEYRILGPLEARVDGVHSLRATAAASIGRFRFADPEGAGYDVAAEMMVASVAVMSDAPFLAAKA